MNIRFNVHTTSPIILRRPQVLATLDGTDEGYKVLHSTSSLLNLREAQCKCDGGDGGAAGNADEDDATSRLLSSGTVPMRLSIKGASGRVRTQELVYISNL